MLITAACPEDLGPPLGSDQHPSLIPVPRVSQRANKGPLRPPPPYSRGRGRSRRPERTAVIGVLVSRIMGGGAIREGCGNRLKGKSLEQEVTAGASEEDNLHDSSLPISSCCSIRTVLLCLQTLCPPRGQTFHTQSDGCFGAAANA